MPRHRKPTRRHRLLAPVLAVAMLGSGVAFAVQEGLEPFRSAQESQLATRTAGPLQSSPAPTTDDEDERHPSPSRAARTQRPEPREKPADERSKKPDPKPRRTPPTPELDPTPTNTPRPKAPSPKPRATRETTVPGSGILSGTNAARANAGLPALTASQCLTEMAQQHAKRLAAARSLYHQDLGAVLSGCGMSTAGENVAMNHTGPSGMVDQWMESPGHRANLLSSQFSLIGVGVAQARDGSWYGVQVFGAK